jgi:hypothetical protein
MNNNNTELCQLLPVEAFLNGEADTNDKKVMSQQACLLKDQITMQRASHPHAKFPDFSLKGYAACMFVERVHDGQRLDALFFCGKSIMSFVLQLKGCVCPEISPNLRSRVDANRNVHVDYIDTLAHHRGLDKAVRKSETMELKAIIKVDNERSNLEEQLRELQLQKKIGLVTDLVAHGRTEKRLQNALKKLNKTSVNPNAAALSARNRLIDLCQHKMIFVIFDDFVQGEALATVFVLNETGSGHHQSRFCLPTTGASVNEIMIKEGHATTV